MPGTSGPVSYSHSVLFPDKMTGSTKIESIACFLFVSTEKHLREKHFRVKLAAGHAAFKEAAPFWWKVC